MLCLQQIYISTSIRISNSMSSERFTGAQVADTYYECQNAQSNNNNILMVQWRVAGQSKSNYCVNCVESFVDSPFHLSIVPNTTFWRTSVRNWVEKFQTQKKKSPNAPIGSKVMKWSEVKWKNEAWSWWIPM